MLFLRAMFGTVGTLGASVPGDGVSSGRAFAMEGVDGWINQHDPRHGLRRAQHRHQCGHRGRRIYRVGWTLGGGRWRRLDEPGEIVCTRLVRGDLGTTWIYIVGPLLGALIGVGVESILKGKPTAAGAVAAQGALGVDRPTE